MMFVNVMINVLTLMVTGSGDNEEEARINDGNFTTDETDFVYK